MSNLDVSATFDSEIVVDFFKNLKTRLAQTKNGNQKFMGLMSAIVFKDIMQHFADERGPDGPWVQWSESYRIQMERKGKGGNKILQDSGRLRNSFIPSNVRNQTDGLLWFDNATTANGYPYAAGHDEGDGKLPARPFMWLSDSAADSMAEQTLQFLIDEGI